MIRKTGVRTVISHISMLCVLIGARAFSADTAQPQKLVLHFFGSTTCGECMEIKDQMLTPLIAQNADKLELKYHNIDDTATIKIMTQFEEEYRVKENSAQELFFGDTCLIGYAQIMASGKNLILAYLATPSKWASKHVESPDTGSALDLLRRKTKGWGFFFGTVATGLADGVNPCAIATMIFLISFLATQKRKRGEILVIGMAYTVTVYCTYFAMGMGLKEVLGKIQGYHRMSEIIRWGACAFAAIVAVLSFRDAVVYAKTKKTQDITLQLPKAVKLQIHKIISGNLGGASLLLGSIIAGFLVTILEAICTGQMYIPYIVAMTRQSELRIVGLAYLAFYNFLFVLPLLIVMVLAYFGLKWNELAKATQTHMVLLKVLLGTVLTGLALYLAFAGIL
jgi:hypothetical protein